MIHFTCPDCHLAQVDENSCGAILGRTVHCKQCHNDYYIFNMERAFKALPGPPTRTGIYWLIAMVLLGFIAGFLLGHWGN